MKKLLFGAVALAMLATASCKKDDDNTATGPSNTLTAAGVNYAVNGLNNNGSSVTINGGSGTTNATIFSLRFGTGSTAPTTGTYKISKSADAVDKVQLTVTRYVNSTLTSYQSQDGSTIVTVGKTSDNKLTISFPATTVVPVTGMGSENIDVSANATQP